MQDDEDIDMKDVLDIIHQTNVNDLRYVLTTIFRYRSDIRGKTFRLT